MFDKKEKKAKSSKKEELKTLPLSEYRQLLLRLKDYQTQINELKEKNEQALSEEVSSEKANQYEEVIHNLEKKVVQTQKERDLCKQLAEEAKETLNQTELQFSLLQTKYSELEKQSGNGVQEASGALQKQIDELSAQVTFWQNKCNELEKTATNTLSSGTSDLLLQQLTSEKERLSFELSLLQTKYTELERNNVSNDEITQEVAQLKAEKVTLEGTVQTLSQKLKELSIIPQPIDVQVEDDLRRKIMRLEHQLQEAEAYKLKVKSEAIDLMLEIREKYEIEKSMKLENAITIELEAKEKADKMIRLAQEKVQAEEENMTKIREKIKVYDEKINTYAHMIQELMESVEETSH